MKIKGQFQKFMKRNPVLVSWLDAKGYDTLEDKLGYLKEESKSSRYNRSEKIAKYGGITGGMVLKGVPFFPWLATIIPAFLASGTVPPLAVALSTALGIAQQSVLLGVGSSFAAVAGITMSRYARNRRVLKILKCEAEQWRLQEFHKASQIALPGDEKPTNLVIPNVQTEVERHKNLWQRLFSSRSKSQPE